MDDDLVWYVVEGWMGGMGRRAGIWVIYLDMGVISCFWDLSFCSLPTNFRHPRQCVETPIRWSPPAEVTCGFIFLKQFSWIQVASLLILLKNKEKYMCYSTWLTHIWVKRHVEKKGQNLERRMESLS